MTEKKDIIFQLDGLKKLREPFPGNQIGKLAKGSKAQTQCPANEKTKCDICSGWHHPKMIHLDYVGHAALTDRFLDADPFWTWEPLALKEGLPAFDASGGLWIRVTICGVSRLGYGNAEPSQYKEIGSREKEVIGDALRNAGMRFGCALELWHKGVLHDIDPETLPETVTPEKLAVMPPLASKQPQEFVPPGMDNIRKPTHQTAITFNRVTEAKWKFLCDTKTLSTTDIEKLLAYAEKKGYDDKHITSNFDTVLTEFTEGKF